MLEIYDETGEITVGIGTNLSRVVHVHQRGKPLPPMPAAIQRELAAQRLRGFFIANVFVDVYDRRYIGSATDIALRLINAPLDHSDVCIFGVYGVDNV